MLRRSCSDPALWIIVWLGAETGLVFFYDQGQAIGSVLGCVLTHVDDMLAAGDSPNLQLFVDALTREREITQSRIIGPSKEGEITHTEIWVAAMPGGGFGIQQCPYVSDVLKSWGMDECRRATSLESHGSWKQQVARDVAPVQILLQNDVRLAQTRAGAMLWLSTGSRPDPLLCFKIAQHVQ